MRGPREYATEDAYYASEYTQAEREAGLHVKALRFAHEASVHGGSQHGSRHGLSRSASKASLGGKGGGGEPVGDDTARGARKLEDAAAKA